MIFVAGSRTAISRSIQGIPQEAPERAYDLGHFMGNGRNVAAVILNTGNISKRCLPTQPSSTFSIDLSWGPVIAPYLIDTPEHLKMTQISSGSILTDSSTVATRAPRLTGPLVAKATTFGLHSGQS